MALGKKLKLDKLIPLIDLSEVEEVESNQVIKDQPELIVLDDKLTEDPSVPELQNGLPFSFLDAIDTGDLKIEFVPSKRKTQKKVFVHISGSLTIRNVGQMKDRIPMLFDEYDHIELVIKDMTGIDITAIQLFNLMRVNFHAFGKYTYVNAELTNEQKQLLNTCGYSEFHTLVSASA